MDRKPIKILLIEDNPGDARLIRELLKEAATTRFELTHADRLSAGQERLGQERFDLLLLDLSLPDSQGLATFNQACNHAPGIPIILLTGLDDDALAIQAMQAGAQDYLVKGKIDGSLLVRAIHHAIERQRLYLDLQKKTSALLHSEARFHNMIEHNADSIVILDETGLILFANPAAETLFDREAVSLLGEKLNISLTQDTRTEFEIVRNGGQKEPAIVEAQVVETNWGSNTAYLASLRDISERKQVEIQLAYQANLLANVQDAIIATDLEFRITSWNPGAETMYGWLAAEVIGQPLKQIVAPKHLDILSEEVLKDIFEEGHRQEETIHTRKDGDLMYVLTSVSLIKDSQGKPLGTVAVNRDINERIKIENELKQRMAQLALISDIGRRIATALELDEVLKRAADMVQQSFDYHHVALFLIEADVLALKAVAGAYTTYFPPGHTQRMDQGINGWVVSHGEKILANDVNAEPRYMSLIVEYTVTRAELCLPIKIAQETVGVLDIQSPHLNAFDENAVIALKILTDQIAVAIENATLYEAVREELSGRKKAEQETIHRNRELTLLNQIIVACANELEAEAMLETACRELALAFNLPQVTAALLNANKTEAVVVAEYLTEGRTETLHETTLVAENASCQYLLAHKKPLVINNAQTDPRLSSLHDQMRRRNVVSLLKLPLLIEQEMVGNLTLESIESRSFSSEEIVLAWSVADQVSGALARIRLTQLHRRLSTAIEQTAESVIITSTTGDILYVNPAFERISGYSRSEAIGQNPRLLQSGQRNAAFYQKLWATISAGENWQGRLVNKKKNGDFYTIDATISPVRDNSGTIVNYVGIQRDVTHELQLEERLHQVISSISDHIYVTEVTEDRQHLNSYLSPNIATLTGYSIEKFTADWSFWPSVVIHPDDRALAAAQSRQLTEGNNSETEYRLVRANGEIIWVRDSGRVVEIGNNRKIIYGVISNITERKQHEQELAYERSLLARRVEERTAELSAANSELARAARLKDEFFANMSHELRTPLNAILGMSEVLRLNVYGQLNPEQLHALDHIEEGGHHLLSLINDILDLSKIEAGKIELQIKPVIVEDICRGSLHFIMQQAQKKKIKIISTFDSDVDIMPADERRLKQVLVNLLNNAVKFTPEGGQIGLAVDGDQIQKVVHFSVWDTGIGITEVDMERLFQPFVQIDSRLDRQHEGTGLGLALVARLVEMHGGGVSVESTVGQGSRFTVSLPWPDEDAKAQEGEETEEIHATRPPPPAAASVPLSTILLVEDNETNIITFRDFLHSRGYRVIVAHSGSEAIELAKANRPDIILMDIQMPGMDGLETTRHIRADDTPSVAAIPIIALTALAMPGDRERCLNAGTNDYLSKPVSLVKLVSTIEAQLQEASKG